ncbi:zinc finger lsd1 subclass family protein [Stylonychia lemnae]|uniref:Zinc finger lsd1 subclass family protein n=1 Tax=Stylonychia lemnae TaxID=5949 RepID=A0A078B6H6_STYLE|nr:zinc finger lsd1 subclass family protein [Stylonychia lemnae]|eukprot:CDW88877.1 zinc finger lsd1 subclass family protein [Stylonychia lemnae]
MESSNPTKQKKFVISTADSRYIKPLLQKLIEENESKGWKETLSKEKFDLKWVSAGITDEELLKILSEKKQMANRFPGIQGLAHKDMYISLMKIGLTLDEALYDFVPTQFNFPQDANKFNEYHKTHQNQVFIAKPVASAEGNSIVLFQSQIIEYYKMDTSLILECMQSQQEHHLYKLLFAMKGLLDFAQQQSIHCQQVQEKYEKPTRENFKKFFMHLTNYSINKHHEEYVESDDIMMPNNASKRTLTSLYLTLQQQGINAQTIKDNISRTCARAFSVYGPMIEHGIIEANNLKPINGKYFQILGFDLLIDENLNAHLLEINDHPSLNIFLEKDYMGGGMGKSLSTVDLYVKKTIVGDTIKLTKKSDEALNETTQFRSLNRILPLEEPEAAEVQETINKFRELYYQLAPVKSKVNMSSSNFEKILTKSELKFDQLGISNIDLSLLFQKQSGGKKSINFQEFFWLMIGLKDMLEKKRIIDNSQLQAERSLEQKWQGSSDEASVENMNERDLSIRDIFGKKSYRLIRLLGHILNFLDFDHKNDKNKNGWKLFTSTKQSDKLNQFIKSTSDKSKWQQVLGWNPDYDDDILDFLDLDENSNYQSDDDYEKHSKKQKKKQAKKQAPQLIDIKYNWDYDGQTDYWSEHQKLFQSDNLEDCKNFNKDQTLSISTIAQKIFDRAKKLAFDCKLDDIILGGFGKIRILKADDEDEKTYEDCPDPYFKNSKKVCQSCPTGCDRCKQLDFCQKCEGNFTLIYGKDFGYCFPDCPKEYYIRTKYDNQESYLNKNQISSKYKSYTPTMMVSQCVKCPFGCGDCLFDEITYQPFCYSCLKGFQFNQSTGYCDVIPCKAGQYRPKPLNSTVYVSLDTNYDDYLCQACTPGCINCQNNTSCNQCDNHFLLYQKKNTYNSSCIECQPYCKTCNYISTTQTSNATKCFTCIDKFFLNKTDQCELNRTCAKGQWFNDVTLQCQQCPTDCLTCQQGIKNGTVVCTSCTNQTELNSNTSLCQDRCNYSSNFYQFSSKTCVKCPDGKYPDISSQVCSNCPNYCPTCSWNKKVPQVECDTCTNESYYDKSYKRCRVNCNETSYFNYFYGQCIDCGKGKFLNITSSTCQVCPANCTSCIYSKSSKRVECDSCNGTNVIDYSTKRCRKQCPASQYYEWANDTCRNCSSGTYINKTTQTCNSCPSGCKACLYNETSLRVECSTCDTFKVIDADRKQCRPQCYNGQNYYWDVGQCRYCPPFFLQNSQTKKCEECPFGCVDCFPFKSGKYCTNCDTDMILSFPEWKCKLKCENETVFSYETNKCERCPAGQYYDSFYNGCKACTSNCLSCSKAFWYSSQPDCSLCKTGYVLDKDKQQCKPVCPANYQYSWANSSCVPCGSGKYYNSTSQSCQICSSECKECIMDSNLNKVNCTSCISGILDSTYGKCRPNCDINSYYDWTSSSCQQCPSAKFYENVTQTCQNCPDNCSACKKNPETEKVQCQECQNNWVLDETYQLCKPICPNNYNYDFGLKKCMNCTQGQYFSSQKQQCLSCPSFCDSCDYNTTSKATQCATCQSGSFLDQAKKLCRPTCNTTSYFDWTSMKCINCNSDQYLNKASEKCTNCPSNCSTCSFNSQTNVVECQSCKSSYVLDQERLTCRVNCNSTSFYDWNTQQCKNCLANEFLNADIQRCQSCPTGCASCSENQQAKSITCQTCAGGYNLDPSKNLCRLNCNSSAYFDWDQNQCVNCQSNQYLDASSQICKACTTNCTSCKQQSDGKIACQSCSSGSQLDSSNNQCRVSCNSNQYYNTNTKQCASCSVGQWLDTDLQQCQSCPQGCYLCATNSSNLPECTNCLSGLILDSQMKRCRKQCTIGQYYDWIAQDCLACSSGCNTCSSSSQCTECQEQFNLVSEVCSYKCTSSQVWNSNTKKCDNLVSGAIRVIPSATTMIKCRNYTVTVSLTSGLVASSLSSVQWSYTNDLKKAGDYVTQFEQYLSSATSSKSLTLTLPNTFTETVTSQFNVTISVTVTGQNGSTGTNTTKFVIFPFQLTSIVGYSTSYTIDGSIGIQIPTQFYYSECQAKGPFDIPSTINIGCMLYDSKSNYIKDLSKCLIKPSDTTNGLTYSVKYYYLPHAYQSALRDTITINTIVQQSSCSIAGSSLITVTQSDTLSFTVTVQNQRSSFVYKWQCQPLTAGAVCGIQSTTQNNGDLSIPASAFTANARYLFTLTITDNSVNQATCSANVQVDPGNVQSMVKLFSSVSPSSSDTEAVTNSYIDPSVDNNIYCQADGTANSIKYSIVLNKVLANESRQKVTSGIKISGNILVIQKNSLMTDSYYEVNCTATVSGKVKTAYQAFNTISILDSILDFSITPTTGTSLVTTYELQITKQKGDTLWCLFGYNLSESVKYLESVGQGAFNNHKMVVKCSNSVGQYALAYYDIVIKKQGNGLGVSKFVSSSQAIVTTNNVVFEEIQDSFQQYSQLGEGQLLVSERVEFQENLLQQLQKIVGKLTMKQIVQAVHIITDIWNEIKGETALPQFQSLVKDLVQTCINLLNESLEDNQVRVLDQDDFLPIIGIFDEILSNYKQICDSAQLIQPILQSISMGAVRITSNLLPDTEQFKASGQNFAIYVAKKSNNQLLIQKNNKSAENLYAFQVKNLSLDSDQRPFIMQMPYNLAMTQYDYTILTFIVFNKNLNYNTLGQSYMSDIISVNAFYSGSPISIGQIYQLGEIVVENLADPINLFMPYKLDSDDDLEQAQCGYLNETKKEWIPLNCVEHDKIQTQTILGDDSSSYKICCSTHLTMFGVIHDREYIALQQKAFRQRIYSLIPSFLLYFAFGLSVILAKKRALKQNSAKKAQTEQEKDSESQTNRTLSRSDCISKSNSGRGQVTSPNNKLNDQSAINHTQNDLDINDKILQDSIDNRKPGKEPLKQKLQGPTAVSSIDEIKGCKCLYRYKKHSKINKMFFDPTHDQNIFISIFDKIVLTNLLLLAYTHTIIIAYYVSLFLQLIYLQAKSLDIILISSYLIQLLLTILFKQCQGLIKDATAIIHACFALNLLFAFVQCIILARVSDNLTETNFRYWALSSTLSLFISCTVEDFFFIPLYYRVTKILARKLKI